MSVPITQGSGTASVASELIGSDQYQKIKLVGGETGSTSVLGVNPDRSINVSIIGSPAFALSGSVVAVPTGNQSVSGTVGSSVIGIVPVQISNASIITVLQGSIAAAQIGTQITSISGQVTVVSSLAGGIFPVSGSVSAVVTNFPTTQNVSGSVVATQGTTPWNMAGSVAATVTNTVTVVSSIAGGIFPISGSVAATVTNTNLNVGGSVVAFQGGAPWAQTNVGSVITVSQGSIAVNIIAGSIAASFTPPANQSVSGTVQTDVRGSVAVAIISGSISATFAPPANQSVSGTVQTDVRSSVAVVIIGGSIAASFTPPANQSVSGTVQTDVRASVAVVIIGGSVATATTNSSVMLLNSPNVIGSVIAYQGVAPWAISGSVASFQAGPQITSLVSTTPSSVQVGASIMGIAPVTLTANTIPPASSILVGVTANTNGSIVTTTGYPQTVLQITSGPGASITAAINFEGTVDGTQFVPIQGYNFATNVISSMATVESNWAFNTAGLQAIRARVSNWSVGSITARAVVSPTDARAFSGVIVGNPSISGTVAATQQGAWNIAGSVAAIQAGTWKPSIASNYVVGSASVVSAIGNLSLGVRNDTLASVLAVSDGQYIPWTVGPAGENIVADAPFTKWVQGTADFRANTGASITVIAAQGASIFTYVREVQVANMGSASVLVTFSGATSSIIGYTIAPAGGGSNYITRFKSNANGAVSASISGVASVLVTMTGFISKT